MLAFIWSHVCSPDNCGTDIHCYFSGGSEAAGASVIVYESGSYLLERLKILTEFIGTAKCQLKKTNWQNVLLPSLILHIDRAIDPDISVIPHKQLQTPGRPVTLLVMKVHSLPPAVCKHVFIEMRTSGAEASQRREEQVHHLEFMWSEWRPNKIPLTPFLERNVPVPPESDQSCSIPVSERRTTVNQWFCLHNITTYGKWFVRLTTNLRKNVDHRIVRVLRRSSRRSDSRRRRAARGNVLEPDKIMC